MGPKFWCFFSFFEVCFPIGATHCAVSVCRELRHFCKTTAVTFTFHFSSAIVHYVQLNLSGGTQVDANLFVMYAFYTDAITKC